MLYPNSRGDDNMVMPNIPNEICNKFQIEVTDMNGKKYTKTILIYRKINNSWA
jgi:chromosomal replication initiation ATPase DnaA